MSKKLSTWFMNCHYVATRVKGVHKRRRSPYSSKGFNPNPKVNIPFSSLILLKINGSIILVNTNGVKVRPPWQTLKLPLPLVGGLTDSELLVENCRTNFLVCQRMRTLTHSINHFIQHRNSNVDSISVQVGNILFLFKFKHNTNTK